MTDELERLRQRNAELEKQLVAQSLGAALVLELRRRGLDQNKIEDVLQILGAEHDPASAENIRSAKVWYTKNNPERLTLTELVDGFQAEKGYFFTAAQQPAPTPAAPADANGRGLPIDAWTMDELAVAAGPTPEAQPAKLPTYTPEQLDAMTDLERSIARASAAPAPEQPELEL